MPAPVRWETLANLVPTDQPGTPPHPAREGRALETAKNVAVATVAEHRRVRSDWFAQARRDLTNLPLTSPSASKTATPASSCGASLQTQTDAAARPNSSGLPMCS